MDNQISLYDPLTADEVEAFPPVQKKLKLDTDPKPEGKCACTMMRGWMKGTATVSILHTPWPSLSSFHTP